MKSEEEILERIRKHGKALKEFGLNYEEEYKDKIKADCELINNFSYELIKALVAEYGELLEFVDKQDINLELCLIATRYSRVAFNYVPTELYGKFKEQYIPKFVSPTWHLVDAHELNKKNPETFKIPSKDEIKKIEIGSIVKLCFELNVSTDDLQNSERMWVTVFEVDGDKFKGKLDNVAWNVKFPDLFSIIEFEAKHIYNINS